MIVPRLYRLQQLLNSRYWLVCESILCIWLARLAVWLLPFRWLAWWCTRPVRQPEIQGPARRQLIRDVAWAFVFAKRKLGVDFVCLSGSIAGQTVLRHRGIGTTLYYGVASKQAHEEETYREETHREETQKGLNAHTWLQDGPVGIGFHGNAADFYVMAIYAPKNMLNAEAHNHLGKQPNRHVG